MKSTRSIYKQQGYLDMGPLRILIRIDDDHEGVRVRKPKGRRRLSSQALMVGREGTLLIQPQRVAGVKGTCTLLREYAARPLRDAAETARPADDATWRTCFFSAHIPTVWTADLAAPDDGGNGSAYCAACVGASAHPR